MNNYEQQIVEKNNEELFEILICSQDYQSEFVELAKHEFFEKRGLSFDHIIRNKTTEEIADYISHSVDYDEAFIQLLEHELREVRQSSLDIAQSKKKSKDNEKVKRDGWLTFFLIQMGFGAILSPILGFSSMSLSNYDIGIGNWFAIMGAISDSVLLLGYVVIGYRMIVAFKNYTPNAIALAKVYLIIAFATNLLSLFVSDLPTSGLEGSRQTSMRLLWQVVWFIYLIKSKFLTDLFPKAERKLYKIDKQILFVILVPVIVWTILAFAIPQVYVLSHKAKVNKYALQSTSLDSNEYGDSRIAFVPPADMEVEELTEGDDVFFRLTQGDETTITVYSTFDTNDTKRYFEECMVLWADVELNEFEVDLIVEKNYTSDGNNIFSKSIKYMSDPAIYRTFVLMFNKITGKCCVLQSYSLDEKDFLTDFVESIRFM